MSIPETFDYTEDVSLPNIPSVPGAWAGYQGAWFGPWPIFHPDWPYPDDGDACVYYLYDHAGVCRYVGQTRRFHRRLSEHARSGKVFTFWVAQWFTTNDLDTVEAVAINMNRINRGDGGHWNKTVPPWTRCWADSTSERNRKNP